MSRVDVVVKSGANFCYGRFYEASSDTAVCPGGIKDLSIEAVVSLKKLQNHSYRVYFGC